MPGKGMARFRTSCVASGQRNAVPSDGAADQANVAEGQKRTNHHGLKSTFVRFAPIADKRGRYWIVRFVP